jgi:hypothetical protein
VRFSGRYPGRPPVGMVRSHNGTELVNLPTPELRSWSS